MTGNDSRLSAALPPKGTPRTRLADLDTEADLLDPLLLSTRLPALPPRPDPVAAPSELSAEATRAANAAALLLGPEVVLPEEEVAAVMLVGAGERALGSGAGFSRVEERDMMGERDRDREVGAEAAPEMRREGASL